MGQHLQALRRFIFGSRGYKSQISDEGKVQLIPSVNLELDVIVPGQKCAGQSPWNIKAAPLALEAGIPQHVVGRLVSNEFIPDTGGEQHEGIA